MAEAPSHGAGKASKDAANELRSTGDVADERASSSASRRSRIRRQPGAAWCRPLEAILASGPATPVYRTSTLRVFRSSMLRAEVSDDCAPKRARDRDISQRFAGYAGTPAITRAPSARPKTRHRRGSRPGPRARRTDHRRKSRSLAMCPCSKENRGVRWRQRRQRRNCIRRSLVRAQVGGPQLAGG